jgi:hypothetical protein
MFAKSPRNIVGPGNRGQSTTIRRHSLPAF